MSRILYKENQVLGSYGTKFIKEVEPHTTNGGRKIRKAEFMCHCGNVFETTIRNIKGDHTKSCGCKTKELLSNSNHKHGLRKHPLYGIWCDMKQRCFNKNDIEYINYGGRGITVCDEWKTDFKTFYGWAISNGYKKGLTLDRKDNDGNYEPDNCRWTTKTIQSRNRRKIGGTSSKYIGVNKRKDNNKWSSKIRVNNKPIPLGTFNTELLAAKARDQYIIDNGLIGFTMNNVLN